MNSINRMFDTTKTNRRKNIQSDNVKLFSSTRKKNKYANNFYDQHLKFVANPIFNFQTAYRSHSVAFSQNISQLVNQPVKINRRRTSGISVETCICIGVCFWIACIWKCVQTHTKYDAINLNDGRKVLIVRHLLLCRAINTQYFYVSPRNIVGTQFSNGWKFFNPIHLWK